MKIEIELTVQQTRDLIDLLTSVEITEKDKHIEKCLDELTVAIDEAQAQVFSEEEKEARVILIIKI